MRSVTLLSALLAHGSLFPAVAAREGTSQVPGSVSRARDQFGEISGQVTGAAGMPVGGAVVVLTNFMGAARRTVITSVNGAFSVDRITAGYYSVEASKRGYVQAAQTGESGLGPAGLLSVAAGKSVRLKLVLLKDAVIWGTVAEDRADGPLVGARVEAFRYTASSSTQSLVMAASAMTDDLGRYRLYGLEPGKYLVRAAASGIVLNQPGVSHLGSHTSYAPVYYPGTANPELAETLDVPGDSEVPADIHFAFLEAHEVSGIVAASGTLDEVTLALEPALGSAPAPATMTRTVHLRSGGAFSFGGIAPGRYVLVARGTSHQEQRDGFAGSGGTSPSGATWATTTVAVVDEDVGGLSLVLRPGAIVSGSVNFDGPTAPPTSLSRVRISISPRSNEPQLLREAPAKVAGVESDGTFRLSDVPPGVYLIHAVAPHSDEPPGVVRGPGEPERKRWVLTASTLGGRDLLDSGLAVGTSARVVGLTLLFRDENQILLGTVRDKSGNPVVGATVIAFPTDPAYWLSVASRRVKAVRCGLDGSYTIRDLPPGQYHLAVTGFTDPSAGYGPDLLARLVARSVSVTLAAGQVSRQNLLSELQ